MNKTSKLTGNAPKKLTVADLKKVIGGGTGDHTGLTVEGAVVEDVAGNKASGLQQAKAG